MLLRPILSNSGSSIFGSTSMGKLSLLVCMQPISTAAVQLLAQWPDVWYHALHTAARQTAVQQYSQVTPSHCDLRPYSSILTSEDQLCTHQHTLKLVLCLQSRHTKSPMMQCSGCRPFSWDPALPGRQALKEGLVSVSLPRTSRC